MNRRRSTSIAGSPLLIGALTALIVVVAVFISYNANNGLPFTPTYDINVQLPQAADLQPGNQVRIGGTRVGVISSLRAHQDPRTGRLTAIAHLKLERSVQPLPADTKAIVQSVSAIGLKYLDLEKGTSAQALKPEHTIPLSQTREPVELDQLFDMFDKKTRHANQVNLTAFGNGLAGRGIGLNETLAMLPATLRNAVPVLRNLASPETGLRRFFIALDRAASEAGPVASQQAGFYSDLDTFLAAWASVAPSLEAAIEGGPPALRQATHSLAFEAPFVEKSTEFMRLLRPGARALRSAAAPLGHAFSVGAVNLRAAVPLNEKIAEASQAFAAFAGSPIVQNGLEDLTHTLALGTPLVSGLAPAQTNCNYVTLTFRNIASLLSESIGIGTVARAFPVLAPLGPNNEGVPSSAPANGPSVEKPPLGTTKAPNNNFLHVNPYPNVGAAGQPRVCEAGNETYVEGKAEIGNLPALDVAHGKDITERSLNLFGQPYPANVQADLGLTHHAKAKKKKRKRK